jgi:DNA invertase Pin-like site-specific DNA recombinase
VRLIGYVRVSRVAGREGDSFISPAVQRERIEAQAVARGDTIVDWQEDLDQPGSKYERPGFQAALEAVERGEADGIAVAALDRFARKVTDAADALRRLEAADGVLVSVKDSLDTSTPVGRFARTMMLAIAELELERTRENWDVARRRSIANGIPVSRPPLGYRRRKDKRFEPDPATAALVRELFRRRAAGESWKQLCAWLDDVAPRESGNWTHQAVSSMIASRTYLGETAQGEIKNTKAHKPLMSHAEWQSAQVQAHHPPRRGSDALLAGLIRCASCGFTMTRMSDGERGYANYRCRTRHSAGICPQPARLSVQRADAYVEQAFLEWLEREQIAVEGTDATDGLAKAVARIEAAEAESAAYRDANAVAVIGRDAYLQGLEHRQHAIDDARAELQAAQRATVALPLGPRALIDVWPNLEPREKRTILSAGIDTVAVKRAHLPGRSPVGDRVRIFWRGQAPVELPGRRSRELMPLVWKPKQVRKARTHHR